MKRIPFLTTAAVAATLFFASCKNSGTSGLDIPNDAAMVVHINASSLTSKLSWEEIKNSSWFKEIAEGEHDSLTKKLMENPDLSGVDIKSDFVFFTKKQGRGGYMVFEGRLKDAAAFEAMVKQQNKDQGEVMKDGDLKYIKTGNGQILSWTGTKFVAMTDAPFFDGVAAFGRNSDHESKSFPVDSLKLFTKELLALKNSSKLEKDNRF